jgi:MFS family permease
MTADGVAANAMIGIGETYLPAFVLAISASEVACGLVSTIPMLVGAVLQLGSPWAVRRLGSYRRWVVLTAVIQAIGFLPLVAAAILGTMPLAATFLIVSLYWATGMAGGTSWNAWAGTLVPERIRPGYFAWRTRFAQLGMVVGLAAGGVFLELGKEWDWMPGAFAVLFLFAAATRVASAYFLSLQREPTLPNGPRLPRPGELVNAVRHNTDSRVILYMLAAQAACYIAGPYFTPYMLGQLELSYVHYLILICTPYITRVVCLPAWGRVVDRIGAHRMLWLSGLLVAPLPVLWNFSDSFASLVAVQIYAGLTWAGYELAQLLLFFDTIPTQRRVGVLTLYNLVNALAIFGGSIVGGVLLSELGSGRDAYWMLFVISTVARLVALLVLIRIPVGATWLRPVSAALAPSTMPALPPGIRVDGPHAPFGQPSVPKPIRQKEHAGVGWPDENGDRHRE